MGILSWTESYGEEMFEGLNMSTLKRDGAFLNITNTLGKKLYLFSVYELCYKCPYIYKLTINNTHTHTIDTRYKQLWRVLQENTTFSSRSSEDNVMCDFEPEFGEFGVYSLDISSTGCDVKTLKEPVNIYFPIITVALIVATILLVVKSLTTIYRVNKNKVPSTTTEYTDKPVKSNRLHSLDAFRGCCVSIMVFGHYGTGGYNFLDHVFWNGLHLNDSIFPIFVWIMGVCIPLSLSSASAKSIDTKTRLLGIFRRSCLLVFYGLLINGISNNETRIQSPLTKLAVGYCVGATITNLLSKKNPKIHVFVDIVTVKFEWLVAVTLLAIHILLVKLVDVPNCPRGYLGPGGYHDDGQHVGCTGGVTTYVDKLLLGNLVPAYQIARKVYNVGPFDAHGVLSHLNVILSVVAGIQGGATLLYFKSPLERIKRWLCWGLFLMLVGGCLCSFSIEDGFIPINKSLWSSSYACITSGIAFITFSFCYYIIDVKKWWTGKPLSFIGMNSIVVYIGHLLTARCVPFRWIVNGKLVNGTHFLLTLENLWAVVAWNLAAYYLHEMGQFYRV